MSFGLPPDVELEFLTSLAKIETEEERMAVVQKVTSMRQQIEAGEQVETHLGIVKPEDIETEVAVFIYGHGIRMARMQQPLATLRRIANS